MLNLLLIWVVTSLAIWLTAAVLPGVHVKSFASAFIVALLFGLLNVLLGWLFFTVFTIATLGLAWLLAFITRWIINGILLLMISGMTKRFKVDGFRWALLASLLVSVFSALIQWLLQGVSA